MMRRLFALALLACMQTWAFGSAAPERLRHAIDHKWRGEMPRTYWFDRQGKMAAYSGMVTPEVVRRFSAAR